MPIIIRDRGFGKNNTFKKMAPADHKHYSGVLTYGYVITGIYCPSPEDANLTQ